MSRAPVRVRPVDAGDIPGLVALVDAVDSAAGGFGARPAAGVSAEHLTARLTDILQQGSRTLLVAVEELTGTIAGLLVAKRDEIGALDLTPVLHVTHLIVAPRHRRRGVGRSLLTAAVHVAEQHGLDRVMATAASGSREANRYLARLGFAPLVMHRVATTSVLRRSLEMADPPQRVAVLRRAGLARAQRARFATRAVRRGA